MAAAEAGDGIGVAFAMAAAGDIDGAIRRYRRMLAGAPRERLLHYGLGQLLLLSGDFAAGWQECEWREQRQVPVPRWRGAPLAGAAILVHGEQGFGDNFQFVRYATQVAARGGRVVVATREGLRRLFMTVPGVSQVVEPDEALPALRYHVPMLSLPYLFATTLASIPAAIPYLVADEARVRAWRERLGGGGDLKVGLVWSGHTDAPYNRRRSPGLGAMRALLDCPGVTFYGLQMGGGRAELQDESRQGPPAPALLDLGPHLTSFDETAAAMMALDLVITPCTATAHLAGALGRPVWIALASFPDWRWLLGRDTSPWYPTARLFRQPRADDWATPIAKMRAELERLAAARRG